LDAHREDIWLQALRPRPMEQQVGWSLEVDRDLRDALGEPLAGAQVEGHASPAPVLDQQLERYIRLGVRIFLDFFLIAVGGNKLGTDEATPVLAAHRID